MLGGPLHLLNPLRLDLCALGDMTVDAVYDSLCNNLTEGSA
jgi:hypothetical protein